MSKPYTESDLSDQFDNDLIWWRKELSDLKLAIVNADEHSRSVLLRALIAMCYAHWEGYVKSCAIRYFQFLTLRRKLYSELERQNYINSFLGKLRALSRTKSNTASHCDLINEILDGKGKRFVVINPDLIDTGSNLSADMIKDICLICGVDENRFEERRTFIDVIILKRRNAIAHGQQEFIGVDEVGDLVSDTLGLMSHFRGLLENKVYTKSYLAT